jgi:hypothetical protein
MVRFVLFLHCPVLPARFGVPLLLVDVPASVVASCLPSSSRSRRRSLPSCSFLDWLLSSLRARGVSLPSPGWFFVRRASSVRLFRPLPVVVLG